MIIGFLVEDRASLLTCSLAGNSFYSPSRAHLFAEIEVNSLPRFRGLLELSTTSPTIFDDASLQPFSFVRTISVRDADAWITPEILPSLLSLPFLPQFTNIRDFRIDGLTLLAEVTPMESILPRSGPRVGIDVGRGFGAFRGVPAEESIADSLDFLSRHGSSTASLGALSLENCRVPSLGWFLRYVSRFPNLKSLSLIDFTWQSVDGTDTDQGPAFRCPQATPQQQRGMLELTLKNQYNPLIACAPRLLFESLSRRLRILQMMHIDAFLSVGQSTVFVSENGRQALTRIGLLQMPTRVRFILTHRTSPSHHSTISRTLRSHRSPCGSKPSNDGSRISYLRSQAPPTSKNSISIFSSLPSRSKHS